MPRFLPLALSALLAPPQVAESRGTSGLNGLQPFMSRSARAAERMLAPLNLDQVGQNLVGSSPSNNANETEFGMIVDLASQDGLTLAVGAPKHDYTTSEEDINSLNEDGGAAFLFKYNGTHWNEHWFKHGVAGEELGERLSLSADGSRIAIRRSDTSPHYVQVFDIGSNGAETQVGSDVIGLDDGDTVSLSADGNHLVVSSEKWSTSKGHVEIFNLQGNAWTSIGSFTVTGGSNNDLFGFATSISSDGERLAIAAPNHDISGQDNVGLIEIHDYDANTQTWSLTASFEGSSEEEKLGFSMDMSGDGTTVVAGLVGAIAGGSLAQPRGSVRVFKLDNGVWAQQGLDIEGLTDNDRFGRDVSVSNDGLRLVASSHVHDSSKGQVRLFEFIGGSWTQLGADLDGLQNQDRFGYSVSINGNGDRLAGGSVWAGRFAGDATGRARVFDAILIPTEEPSQAPSVPQANPIPTSTPSLAPSVSPAPSTSASPTEYANPDKFSWDIFPIGNATVTFDDENADEEITFNYNISRRQYTVVVYENDCNTTVPDSVIGIADFLSSTSATHGDLEVDLDIKQDTVQDSDVWTSGAPGVGYINLCIRVDLLLNDNADTSVHFHETKILVTIDLTQGFTVSEVLDLDRTDASQLNQNAELSYTVLACQCDSSLVCNPQTVTQGDDVFLCLETNATNVEFVGIESLVFTQNGAQGTLTRSPIINGAEDALTAISLQGNECNIRTQMIAAFFTEDEPADVLAEGVAIMGFTNSNRQLRANIVYRNLEDSERNLEGFEARYGLAGDEKSSASIKTASSMMAVVVGSAFFFL